MSNQLNENTDDIENDDEGELGNGNTDTGENEWTPPTKDEWEFLVSKKKTADGEAAKRKRWLLDAGINPKTGEKLTAASGGTSTATDDTRDYTADLRQSEQSGLSKGVAIYAELVNAGVNPKRVNAVLKFLDTSEITFDEDGLEGLTEQIADLKEDYPEFFKRERMKTTDASAVGAGKKTVSNSSDTQSWEDQIRERFSKGLI
ncbi:phage scaffolding protein [Streptomyces sp. NPDC088847]|uniref:phage scaffolding protein n=1 Tax=Streptomyces sp. NPDC088847 TaxID=3365909 RepID=UPI0038150971